MKRNRQNRPPRFIWQGLLILFPVLVLAKLGAYSIWQDRRSVAHEARARAEELAERLLENLWTTLSSNLATNIPTAGNLFVDNPEQGTFTTDRIGRLLQPPPYERVPVPIPLDDQSLSPEQRDLWHRARQATFHDPPRAESVWREFLATTPPPEFRGPAHFALGSLLAQLGHVAEAAAEFSMVRDEFPTSRSEAGLPLAVMAELKLKRLANPLSESAVESIFNRAMELPSALTAELMRERSAYDLARETNASGASDEFRNLCEKVRRRVSVEWQQQERLRGLQASLLPLLRTNPEVPMTSAADVPLFNRLDYPLPTPALQWVKLREERVIAQPSNSIPNSMVTRRSDNAALAPPTEFDTPESPRRVSGDSVPPPGQAKSTEVTTLAGSMQSSRLVLTSQWLLARAELTTGFAFTCRSEPLVRRTVEQALTQTGFPQYLNASVNIGGREIVSSNSLPELVRVVAGKGGGQTWRNVRPEHPPFVLARAARTRGGNEVMSVAVHLTSPQLLFDQQRSRAISFAALIAVAILTGFVGFFGAYRAFRKQHRLAELKSNFVSSVSHELRAPIASVRLMAEGLERGKVSEPAKQREYFRFIVQECRRLTSMVENVLDFSRIEQGRKQYEMEPTDLGALVRQTVQVMQPGAEERGIRLTLMDRPASEAPDAFAAHVDGPAIQQALVNLIDNAIKHSPRGLEVLVGLERTTGANEAGRLQLWVEDSGEGVPLAEQKKIFERFYRVGSELRRETPGVGIGLSIVKHIVESHGGIVFVDSEPGKGSRFTIELPFETAEAPRRREEGH